jgi:hypothetical protein
MKDTLHLNLKAQWFDMIASGEKTEEYRSLSKYWGNRLTKLKNFKYIEDMELYISKNKDVFRQFKTITFSNGYSKERRQFVIKCHAVQIGFGNSKWGAEKGKKYFCITLGQILTKNF